MKLKVPDKKYHQLLFKWLSPLIAVMIAGAVSGIGISFKSMPIFLLHIIFYVTLFFFMKWFMSASTASTTQEVRKIDDIKETDDELTMLYFEGVSRRAQEQRARWLKNIKKWIGKE